MKKEFINPKNKQKYFLVPANEIRQDEQQIANMVNICNQPEIYSILFQNKLKGEAYGAEKARGFFKMANDGWEKQQTFIFAIVDAKGDVCGMIDIKDNNLQTTEVGYWASNQHRGIISKALELMLQWAEEYGYQSFYARVRKNNFRSQNVLSSNGFSNVGDYQLEEDGVQRFRFEKKL